MNEKERDRKINETHDVALQLKTVLLGANGDQGLVGDVKQIGQSHYKLRGQFRLLLGILVGSGVLTGAGFGIAKLVS